MKTSTENKTQQLRKAAILVATLDGPFVKRLLADLPARDAAAVEQIVAQLEDIDPAEYQAVVADFRQGIRPPPHQSSQDQPTSGGVELDESLLARFAAEENRELPPATATETSSTAWATLNDADAATLVEMLSVEQPQTIAVVLSRLETSQAAELVGRFSPALQVEVLTRLADLDPADQQALEVVESQLADWIQRQRQRQQRMAAGRDLVQRILQCTPESQQQVLLMHLGQRAPALAATLSPQAAPQQLPAQTPTDLPAPLTSSSFSVTVHEPAAAATLPPTQPAAEDPLTELEALDDQGLLRALRHTDRSTVMLALAGASESLMKRIVRGLPRRRANQFRQQVRAIGPTRLSDMLSAQRKLLHASDTK